MASYMIKKILNNNVVVAKAPSQPEVIMIGKGIGFAKQKGQKISEEETEKVYTLIDQKKQEQYKQLLFEIEMDVFEAISEALNYIQTKMSVRLSERALVAMTDHIAFAVKRWKQGIEIKNPFLDETRLLYPLEYEIANAVTGILNRSLRIELPKDEIGFIALHIHSGISNRSISQVNQHSQLVARMISEVQQCFTYPLNENTIGYSRLVSHLHHVIERTDREEQLNVSKNLEQVLKKEYPICYNLAWKLIHLIEQSLNKEVQAAEAVYITIYLQRLSSK